MEEVKVTIDDPRAALVGTKVEHYIPIFDDLDEKGGSSWNWCGFLFSPMWFAYRKMFGWSAIAIIGPQVISFIIGMVAAAASASDSAMSILSRIIGLVIAIIFGGIANSVYKKRIDKLVKEMPADEQAKASFIKQKGGVSPIGMVIALVIYIAIIMSLTFMGSAI